MTAYQALDALGDPTRRLILERLRLGPAPVGVIADQLPVTRPAVSQHLRVLERSGLVTHEPTGTRNVYRIDLAGLASVRDWLDGFWDEVLDAYIRHVEAGAGRETMP